MDMRLKTMPYEIDGHKLRLCCNMAVLADLQEENASGAGLTTILDVRRSLRSFTQLLAAMINEAADAAGLDLHYTAKDIARRVDWADFQRLKEDVFGLFFAAVEADAPAAEDTQAEDSAEKKEEASKVQA